MTDSDEDLVILAQRGDRQALAMLIQRYSRPVYSLCRRMLPAPHDAEDLTQETFLRFCSSLGSYRPDRALKPWLFRIALNACFDVLRHRQRNPHIIPLDGSDDGFACDVEDTADLGPEGAWLRREECLAVLEAVRALAPDYRAVIVLRYQEGLSYGEIAEALEVPVTTVETRLFRAKRMMRPLLAELRPGDGHDDVRKEAMTHGLPA